MQPATRRRSPRPTKAEALDAVTAGPGAIQRTGTPA
jgi:hypothetical protein